MSDKLINTRCRCGQGLNWVDKDIVVIYPCEHLQHKDCIENKKLCSVCNNFIEKIYTEDDLNNLFIHNKSLSQEEKEKYKQNYIDLLSMKNYDNLSQKSLVSTIKNMPRFFELFTQLFNSSGHNDTYELAKNMLSLINAKIKIKGKQNIYHEPKVIISNHVSYLDFIILYYIFRTGFLASKFVQESMIGKGISELLPILIIDRGSGKNNTTKRMARYIKKNKNLCLFPEGIFTHPKTLIKFRTGAFYTGYPVQPVIIKYNDNLSDSSIPEFIQKILSIDKTLNITVKILPVEYPPFNEQKIEEIRTKMAKSGKMYLSRVSNRDIKEI
jgi:1-acyl-sn-glycerol-3-phosphate acyltransferase